MKLRLHQGIGLNNLIHNRSKRTIVGIIFYSAILLLISAIAYSYIPIQVWEKDSYEFFLIIGVIAIWRYGWKILNLIRALIYKRIVYPKIKKESLLNYKAPDEMFILVTSYRMSPEMNYNVYASIFREASKLGCPINIISLSTDRSDVKILDKVQEVFKNSNIKVFNIFQDGTGKRSAMYDGMKFIKKLGPQPNSAIVLMDGDCMLGEDVLSDSYAVLHYDNGIGAVTVNNTAQVIDNREIVREWYNLKLMNRDFYMSSHALSRKVLVLTGRFSMFKPQAIMSHEFISNMKYDYINHWKFNKIRMLTGDDKTTWYHLLKEGWDMLYLPDAFIYPIEELPERSFFKSTIALSRRWSGNMLRNNFRALKLGIFKTKVFPWIAILDQRISIWTTLSGPIFALGMVFFVDSSFIWVYILWLITTRLFQSFLTFLITKDFHPSHIFLLIYDQFGGSLIKSYGMFNMQKQKWNRQKIKEDSHYFQELTSNILWIMSLILIFTVVFVFINSTPSLNIFNA